MSNQSQGRKKSQFPGLTTIPADAYMDFVSNGTNYRIAIADFFAALGVTGSIEQDGAITGVPVLDIAGTVNKIRNLEPGAGILSSVSPENGISIAHNFQNGDVGVDVLTDITADSPIIRSLLAGSGINIAVSGEALQISAPGVTVASNVVIINQMSDFPAPVSGVITLESDKGYLVSAALTTSDRFVLGDNTIVFGSDRFVASITYSGSNTLFTGVDISAHIKNITLDSASGKIFDVSSTLSGDIFLFDNVTVTQCDEIGSLDGMAGVRMSNLTFADVVTNGVSFTGNNGVYLLDSALMTINGGNAVDLASATFDVVSCVSSFATLAGGTFFITGLASSGNINSGGLGSITGSRFFGAGTALENVSTNDAQWQFIGNNTIPDTRPDALISMQGNATETVISASSTPVLIAGTWVVELESQFTSTIGGRMTYDGAKDIILPILFSCSVDPASGTNISISVLVAINGTVVANSLRTGTASSGSPASITLPWQAELTAGDYIEIFVQNNDTTSNIIVPSAVGRIN